MTNLAASFFPDSTKFSGFCDMAERCPIYCVTRSFCKSELRYISDRSVPFAVHQKVLAESRIFSIYDQSMT